MERAEWLRTAKGATVVLAGRLAERCRHARTAPHDMARPCNSTREARSPIHTGGHQAAKLGLRVSHAVRIPPITARSRMRLCARCDGGRHSFAMHR